MLTELSMRISYSSGGNFFKLNLQDWMCFNLRILMAVKDSAVPWRNKSAFKNILVWCLLLLVLMVLEK